MKSILGILVGLAVFSAAHQAVSGNVISRAGGGLEYGIATGDTDSMPGAYVYIDTDLPEPVSLRFAINHFGADYELGTRQGSFDTTGVEVLFCVTGNVAQGKLYGGAGVGHYFNDFSNIEFPDKLGLLFAAGWRVQTSDRWYFDATIMHRSLRPDHLDPAIGQIEMDALVLRAGLGIEF